MSFYALKLNPEGHGTAGNDEVVFSPAISVNIRSTTTNWFFEFRIKLDALPSANAYILGGSATANTGIAIRFNAGQYTLAFIVGGTLIFQSSVDMFLADGEFHIYRVERSITVSNEVIFKRDGSEFGSRFALTTGTSTLACARFGRGSSTGTFYTSFEMDYFICSSSLPLYAEWRADLSAGSGTNLLTTDGSRDGTLLNFTAGAEWAYYASAIYVRAMLLKIGQLSQITDAEVGTGKKPLVLLDGEIKERSASEGIPIVYESGVLRTLAAGETLLV